MIMAAFVSVRSFTVSLIASEQSVRAKEIHTHPTSRPTCHPFVQVQSSRFKPLCTLTSRRTELFKQGYPDLAVRRAIRPKTNVRRARWYISIASTPGVPTAFISARLVLEANLIKQGAGSATYRCLVVIKHFQQALPDLSRLLAGIDGLPDACLLVVRYHR